MTNFRFGKGSLARLQGVDPRLVRVAKMAIQLSPIDFTIVEGLRTKERQAEYVRTGASRTMNSRHLTGDAYDFCPWIDGKLAWKNVDAFLKIIDAHFEAADRLGILIQSGSDFDMDGIIATEDEDEDFMDAPHIQIPWPYRMKDAAEAQERRMSLRKLDQEKPNLEARVAELERRLKIIEEK